jgi:alkanesulfonate monooxygenase SsuD/methylene tetrahydromethanopterin reductase-like flavin-dependent oxidoreductase (luciferase family)
VAVAESAGLDLVGVQDHPYVPSYIDAFTLIADLAARTTSVSFFPDVTNLPLRPVPMLARQASALSLLSGGRFHLGLGAGGHWDAIVRLGAPRQTRSQALQAQAEAVVLLRALWESERPVTMSGTTYSVRGLRGQKPNERGIEIWLGAQGPRSLALTGQVADGWAAPIPSYLPYEKWTESNDLIDRAARDSGRQPADIRRIAQPVGAISPTSQHGKWLAEGDDPIRADVRGWADALLRLHEESRFTGFVFWPEDQSEAQILRFASVADQVRARLSSVG